MISQHYCCESYVSIKQVQAPRFISLSLLADSVKMVEKCPHFFFVLYLLAWEESLPFHLEQQTPNLGSPNLEPRGHSFISAAALYCTLTSTELTSVGVGGSSCCSGFHFGGNFPSDFASFLPSFVETALTKEMLVLIMIVTTAAQNKQAPSLPDFMGTEKNRPNFRIVAWESFRVITCFSNF